MLHKRQGPGSGAPGSSEEEEDVEEVTLSASCRNKVAPTGRLRTIEMDSFPVAEARVQGLRVGRAGSSRRLSGSPLSRLLLPGSSLSARGRPSRVFPP